MGFVGWRQHFAPQRVPRFPSGKFVDRSGLPCLPEPETSGDQGGGWPSTSRSGPLDEPELLFRAVQSS